MKELLLKQTNEGHVLLINEPITVKGLSNIAIEVQSEQALWLQYYLYDALGELRAQYLHRSTPQPVVIHEQMEKSSPYTVSGPIIDGEWQLNVIAVRKQSILAGEIVGKVFISERSEEEILRSDDIKWLDGDNGQFSLQVPEAVQDDTVKWLKGDFHTHTIYTDGQMTREENMEMARKKELDFFVATDHNIVPTSWCQHDTNILVIPGVEVTAISGHFNILGAQKSPFQFVRIHEIENEDGMNKVIDSFKEKALISINHPFLTEWKWKFQQTSLASIDSIEIMNDPTYPANKSATEEALQAWNLLLNDGYQITGIGGSDSHLRPDQRYDGSDEPSLIGDPGTFVFSRKTIPDILRSVKNGHVVVSRGGSIDIQLDHYLPGQQVEQRQGEIVVSIDSAEPMKIEWIVDGEKVRTTHDVKDTWQYAFEDDEYHWIRVDIRNHEGHLCGFTNPYYFGNRKPVMQTWGDLLVNYKEYVS